MKRSLKVESGNMIPIQSPDLSEPALYTCPDCKTLSVFCRTSPEIMKKYLAPTPFEYVSDNFVVYVSDMTNCDTELGGFFDMGIIVPVKYKNIYGGNYLFEYEDQDFAIIAGRELWGYPKKYAKGNLEEKEGKIIGTAIRNGVEIIRLEMELNKPPQGEIPNLKLRPHIQLHTIPKADGPGIFSQRVLARDTSPDFVTKRIEKGAGSVTLRSVPRNPLDEFAPLEVYGAIYEVGDFASTNEHGWAKVLDVIV